MAAQRRFPRTTGARLAYRHGDEATRDGLVLTAARDCGEARPATLSAAFEALARPSPRLPWSGRDVIARGVPAGREVGAVLARAEAFWIAADFPSSPAILAGLLEQALAPA